MIISQSVIDEHIRCGVWRQLEKAAIEMVSQAETMSGGRMKPVLGGGTRLMLALRHRLSDDIDLFIRDPQWIGYLSPRLNDEVSSQVKGYEEASDLLKLQFPQGEIDFIVRMSLLGQDPEKSEDCAFDLEPVGEVLAKKLFYRGWALTPRDLFDWWAINELAAAEIEEPQMGALLQSRSDAIDNALSLMHLSSTARAKWDSIRATRKPDMEQVAEQMRERLDSYLRSAQEQRMSSHPRRG